MLRSRFEIKSKLGNYSMLCSQSPRGKENRSLCREYTLPRDQEGTRIKGWIQSNVRFGQVSDIKKVCNGYGRYSIEVQVQSLLKDQTDSWIRIVNGIDKFVREPCRSKGTRKLWGNPLQKRPILKPSSTSGWDFFHIEQRQTMD